MHKKLSLLLICFILLPDLSHAAKTKKISTKPEDAAIESEVLSDKDTDEDILPEVEVEKYSEINSKLFKAKIDDKLSFFLNFQFNNMIAKDRSTFSTFNLNTSSETDVGVEYTKFISDNTNIYGSVSLNQFSISEATSITPTLEPSSKSQVTATAGGQYLFTEKNLVGFNVNYKPHYYLNQNAAGRLVLEHAPSSSFGFNTENHFYKNDELLLGLDVGFEYITNPQYTGTGSTNGLGFNAAFIYQQEFKTNDKLRVKFNYIQTNLDTSLYNLIDNAMSISFLYSLPY